MSLTKFMSCDTNGMSLDALFRSLMVTHTDGTKGFRAVIVNVTDCNDLAPGIDCDNTTITTEQALRERIVLDDCGKPAVVFYNTANAS